MSAALFNNSSSAFAANAAAAAYTTQLATLRENLSQLLEDFKDRYVEYKLNPANSAAHDQYDVAMYNIQQNKKDLIELSNAVFRSIQTTNDAAAESDIRTARAKHKQDVAARRAADGKHRAMAAVERRDEMEDIHNTSYLRNWSMVACIGFGLWQIRSLFSASASSSV